VADERASVERVGEIEIKPRLDGYAVLIRLNTAPPHAEWVKLFNHPSGLDLTPLVRRGTVDNATIEIIVRDKEQMNASVRYAEQAIAHANQAYNDEVLPRRERHRRMREAANSQDQDRLDAMARAARAL
jgi:hypothetical protein